MRIIFPFSQKIKRKKTYKNEEQDIHITRITATLRYQHVIF